MDRYEESLKKAQLSYQDYKEQYDKMDDKCSNAALIIKGAIGALEQQFSELVESEDDKIKNAIIRLFELSREYEFLPTSNICTYGKAIAWLKKQKTAEWDVTDQKMFTEIILDLKGLQSKDSGKAGKAAYQEEIDWLESIKNKAIPQIFEEWSEDDKKALKNIIDDLIEPCYDAERIDDEVKWLKSIKPKNRWIPTKEQMDALSKAIWHYTNNSLDHTDKYLNEIYDKLKWIYYGQTEKRD